ncbi:MAG: DUF4175 family protein [Bacteroidia bacterium]
MTSNYQSLLQKLDEFIRKYYKNQLLRGGIYSVGLVLLFFISVTVLEYYAHFSTLVRTLLFYSFLATSAFILTKYVVIPLTKLYKLGKIISYEEAASIIGKHFGNVQDKLINTLQLQQQVIDTGELIIDNGSQESRDKSQEARSKSQEARTPTFGLQASDFRLQTPDSQLITASINQKIQELKPIQFTLAIDLSENKKYLKYAVIPVLLIAVILFSAPSIIKDGTKRLVKHTEYFEKQAPFQFVITNTDLKTVAQEDFELKVKLTGDEVPDNVFVEIGGNEFKLNKENIVNFSYLFKNVQKNTSFQLSADGFKSKEYELIALPKPILLNFNVSLAYPKYLRKKDEELKNTGDLVIPAGTKVTWGFTTQNTNRLRMSFNDTSFALPIASENSFNYSTRILKDKTYAITTANEFLKNKDSITYTINVIPDAYPQINVEEKKDSTSTKRLFFRGEVKDDYGFNKLIFNYRFITTEDSVQSETYKKLTLNSKDLVINKNSNQDMFFHQWDMNELGIAPGDELEYYFEVWDNDGVTGSKSTRSSKMIFKAPTAKELQANAEKNNDKIKDALEESLSQAKDIQKELADLQRKVAEKKNMTWEEKKRLQELLDKQKELQKKVEQIKNENKQNNQQQNEYQQPNEEMLEKQRQLEELFDKVMTPEMQEKYNELQKLMEKLDKNKIQDALEKMKLDNKDVMKELDRNLEVFKQLEFEQKLEKSIENLEKLAQKEEELSKKTEEKNANAEQQKQKQEELNKEFQDLKKDLKDLEKKNSELENPHKMDNTEQQQQDIEKEMEKSSDELGKNDKKNASKSQKSAAQKMQKMSEQMSKMKEEMEQEAAEEDIDNLRGILDNLLHLSFDQEALMDELGKTKNTDPQIFKINQKQKKLQDDAKMIEDSLLALSKRVPEIKSAVNKEITAINMNMEKAVEQIAEVPAQPQFSNGSSYKSEALSRQQFAMTSINNLALMLNEALKQMQDAASKPNDGKPGSKSCKKPGSGKPSASSLRKMQEQLNKQIEKLKGEMEKNGNKPNQKPGAGGTGGMSKELAKMAAQQEAIRKEMQKMANELNKDGKDAGGMNKTLEKMEQTETDLVNKMISQETLMRQQEILTRLLESEKAEKEREMDQKRQSNEAKNENFSNPNEFFEYNRLKQKETELLKTVSPSLTPFFKTKVNQYFTNFEE